MLTKITLTNFQSHKHTEISDLSPGINCIVGESQTGKSAIYRALYWLYFNDYTGKADSFIRKGASACSVKVWLDSGHSIERVKGSALNDYVITEPDGKEQRFTNIGSSVPDEVSSLLQIGTYIVPGEKRVSPVNFSQQGEPTFLLYKSGPERARMLNCFTGADKLDKCIRELTAESRDYAKERKNILKQLETIVDKISESDYLEQAEQILAEFSASVTQAQDVRKRLDNLVRLKLSGDTCKLTLNKCQDSLNSLKALNADDIDIRKLWALTNRYKTLTSMQSRVRRLIAAGNKALEGEDRLPVIPLDPSEVSRVWKRHKALLGLNNRLVATQKRASAAETGLKQTEANLRDAEAAYKKLLSDLGVCPVCGSEVTEKGLKTHLNG